MPNLTRLLFLMLLALTTTAWSHPNSVQIPEKVDTSLPEAPQPTANRPRRSDSPITIFTAKTILTMDPMQPRATAVAVQDGHILAVGDLEQMKKWGGQAPISIDDRFAQDVLLPGFIEAHMHPQITGILWEGIYVGRFDRFTPAGRPVKGMRTKQEVVQRIAEAAKAAGDNDTWLVAWGYQPEFYNGEPLTVSDLDPVTGKHPILIENASMHIYYLNSLALKAGDFTAAKAAPGMIVKDGKLTGEFQELSAIESLLPKLPKIDEKLLLKASWNAAKLAHQVGVTSIADASFGTIQGSYQAYRQAASDPSFPVRTTLYPVISVLDSPLGQKLGGLDYVKRLMASNDEMLSIGAIKFLTDGSLQGLTANLKWPYYFCNGQNGTANMTYAEVEDGVSRVHRAGLQCMIHTNGDQATEWAIKAIKSAQDKYPRHDHRHRLEHNQMVTENQLQQMAELGIATNLFINQVHYWGDLHPSIVGPDRAAKLNPLRSAQRHQVRFATHSDASVTRLDPLLSVWAAATRQTLNGSVLGPEERISVADALKMVTIDAAYLMFQDDVKGSISPGKLADFAVLAEDPLAVPVDRVKEIKVLGTVLGGKVFPR
jgi:predicted amidohydrolase YtcJ